MTIDIRRRVNLSEPVYPETLKGTLYQGENLAHKFIISTDTAFSGSVSAKFLRADGQTLELLPTGATPGTGIEDGAAWAQLPQACYDISGRFGLAIYLTADGSTSCIYACVGSVYHTEEGTPTDPGDAIPTPEELAEMVEDLEAALLTIPDAAVTMNDSAEGIDLDVADESGNVILRMANGHLQTKNFDSSVKRFSGKKWVCIGDSLTENNIRTTKHYHDYIAAETGITVVNLGKSGRGYAKEADSATYADVVSSIPNDADLITIFGSGNDLSSGKSLGEITDTGTTTICGCINTTLTAIYTSFMTTPLGIITPTPWKWQEPSSVNTDMQNYAAALVQICARRGIPCLDLYHESLLHPSDADFRAAAYSKDGDDGVHPDETGHALIAPRIREFIAKLL